MRNNSGKTSFVNLFEKFFGEEDTRFALEDFSAPKPSAELVIRGLPDIHSLHRYPLAPLPHRGTSTVTLDLGTPRRAPRPESVLLLRSPNSLPTMRAWQRSEFGNVARPQVLDVESTTPRLGAGVMS
ncbi:hypothetical protein [Streptomyces bauhiniae]|uniref:hypothetical protein n=1 Tax=Streptomyces bauhiniae TaxID=2340725 RepID=UPI00365FEB85